MHTAYIHILLHNSFIIAYIKTSIDFTSTAGRGNDGGLGFGAGGGGFATLFGEVVRKSLAGFSSGKDIATPGSFGGNTGASKEGVSPGKYTGGRGNTLESSTIGGAGGQNGGATSLSIRLDRRVVTRGVCADFCKCTS